jgi:hypothetical protein
VNSHIELVKRWLAGEDVSNEELRANSVAAVSRARADSADAADHAAARAAHAAAHATWANARTTARGNRGDKKTAAHWVKKYEELTNEKTETI